MTGYWKTDQNDKLGLFHFIGPLIATLIHCPCTVALTSIADWSAFLELVLLMTETMRPMEDTGWEV